VGIENYFLMGAPTHLHPRSCEREISLEHNRIIRLKHSTICKQGGVRAKLREHSAARTRWRIGPQFLTWRGFKKSYGRPILFRLRFSADSSPRDVGSVSDNEGGVAAFLRATEVLALAVAGGCQLWYLWSVSHRKMTAEKLENGKAKAVELVQLSPEHVLTPTPLPTAATVLAILISLVANLLIRRTWKTRYAAPCHFVCFGGDDVLFWWMAVEPGYFGVLGRCLLHFLQDQLGLSRSGFNFALVGNLRQILCFSASLCESPWCLYKYECIDTVPVRLLTFLSVDLECRYVSFSANRTYPHYFKPLMHDHVEPSSG
jgi:hypothetical protein